MIDVKKLGWAEEMGLLLASKDEGVRAEAIGLPRLRCFRRSESKNFDSCRRGGQMGAIGRAAKRKFGSKNID